MLKTEDFKKLVQRLKNKQTNRSFTKLPQTFFLYLEKNHNKNAG